MELPIRSAVAGRRRSGVCVPNRCASRTRGSAETSINKLQWSDCSASPQIWPVQESDSSLTVVYSGEIPLLSMICTSLDFSTRILGVPLGALLASGPNVLPRITTLAALVIVIAGPTGQAH